MTHRLRLFVTSITLLSSIELLPLQPLEAQSSSAHARSESVRPAAADVVGGVKPGEVEPDDVKPNRDALVDAELEAYRVQLLDLAFRAASAFPTSPHVKTRARLQDAVVGTCLELRQVRRAADLVESVDTWRRGSCYADLAMYLAREKRPAQLVRKYVDLAKAISDRVEVEGGQDWARDRIRVKIAGAHLLMGDVAAAREFGVVPTEAEAGKVATYASMRTSAEEFDDQMKSLGKVIEIGGLDATVNALEAYAQLYDRFYADEARRASIERTIQDSWGKSPVQVRFDVMMKLVEFARAHGDAAKALELIGITRQLVDSVRWTPEDQITLLSRLAGARHRSGDAAGAKSDLEAVHAIYEKERLGIPQFERGMALCVLAENHRESGDVSSAIASYARAIDEVSKNPNARPRAEVLVSVCRSMAKSGTEPDAALRARLDACFAGLKDPW